MSAEAQREWIRNEVQNGLGLSCVIGFFVWVTVWGCLVTLSLFHASLSSKINIPEYVIQAVMMMPTLMVQSLWYFLVRPRRPYFARGVGYSILVSLACMLGMAMICHG
jgi:cobalamin biosynthesis protein CobD/CbiB